MNIMKPMLFAAGLLLWNEAVRAATDGQEAICSDPAVIACENFEDRAVGNTDLARAKYKNSGWSLSNTAATGPGVTSNSIGVFDGARALQMTYPAGNNTGGGFLDWHWPTTSRTIYYRWYTKWSGNFQWSYTATKHMEMYASNGLPAMFQFWFKGGGGTGSKDAYFYNYFTQQGNAWIPSPNLGGSAVTLNVDKWYCLEARYTMNSTPTSSDGYLQGWVDGVQRWEYPNVNLDNQTGAQGPITGSLVSGYWNCYSGGTGSEACTDPVDVHPLMHRWHDNMVVSTQRIGCLGNPVSGDTSAPTVPAGLSAQVASSSQINLTWTASTDNVGVTGYKIFRAGAQIATSAGTSYSNTGLTASTAYSYTVAAYDAAGNTSAQSSGASATTLAGAPAGPGGLLVDFGGSASANTFGLAGWSTVIKDVYTTYSSAGPGGTMSGFNGGYDFQGVTGTARTFAAGDEIVVTWYNSGSGAATFTPQISMSVPGRVGSGAGWYPMSPVTIPSAWTAASRFAFSAATSGAYSLVNVNVNLDNSALVCDKIALVSAAAGATCDANNDGSTNVVDVQLAVNQALGAAACASDINQDGTCNVLDVQRVANAALGGACVVGP